MSAYTQPIVLHQDGTSTKLERTHFTQAGSTHFSERWLQKALFNAPESIPAREIDPHIGALVPICMELPTGAGIADIIYVTETGQITLVETKLWRNPEARREVVAQILDYAKQLSTWTFEDLDRETAAASRSGPGHILKCVTKANPELDVARFIDGINSSLKSGDFLLMIIGDGIRSGTESLVSFIQQYGSLRFHFGLVEVAAYQIGTSQTLLLPRILAKTEIITRTVIIGSNQQQVLEVAPESDDPPSGPSPQAAWFQSFWGDFRSVLRLDDGTQPIPTKLPKSTNFFLAQPPAGSMAWISIYLMSTQNRAGVYLSFAKAYERAKDVYEQLLDQREEIEQSTGYPLKWERDSDTGKIWISTPTISYIDLNESTERSRVINQLALDTNRMVNAFRHRLSSMIRKLDDAV
jgi:Domain of unknown function (DUF4268)